MYVESKQQLDGYEIKSNSNYCTTTKKKLN